MYVVEVAAEKQCVVNNEIATAVRHTFVFGLGGILIRAGCSLPPPFFTHYLSQRDHGVIEFLDPVMSLPGMFLNDARMVLPGTVSSVATAVNLAANYLLIVDFGIIGAAWATLLGFLELGIGSYYCSQWACPVELPTERQFNGFAPAAGSYMLSRRLHGSSLAVALRVKGALLVGFSTCFLGRIGRGSKT